jgi:hypothetical protein
VKHSVTEASDSDLRQALLGTWGLISWQIDVDSTVVKPLGDNPRGYLVYTLDGHVLVQIATRSQRVWPPDPEVLKLPPLQRIAKTGLVTYCGTFAVHDGQVTHHIEFAGVPSVDGSVQPRTVVALDGDQLILGGPQAGRIEWQRVH